MEGERDVSTRGFSVVEVLVVLAILALLASIMIPRYASKREQAYVAAKVSDLRNLGSSMETYYRVDGGEFGYTDDETVLGFIESEGVDVTILETTPGGWSARATHASTPWTCAYYFGDAEPVDPATRPGTPGCARP